MCFFVVVIVFKNYIIFVFGNMLPLISFIGRYWKWIQDKVYSLYANFWQTAENCRQVHAFVVKLRHLSLRNCWNLVHLSLHKINHTFSQISIKSGGQRMVIWKLPTIPSGVVVCTSVFFFSPSDFIKTAIAFFLFPS